MSDSRVMSERPRDDIEHLARAIHEGYRRCCENVVVPKWDEAGESLRDTRREHAKVVLYLRGFCEVPELDQCLADQIVSPEILGETGEQIAERLVREGRVVQGRTDGKSWYLIGGDVPVPEGMLKINLDALFRRLGEATQ